MKIFIKVKILMLLVTLILFQINVAFAQQNFPDHSSAERSVLYSDNFDTNLSQPLADQFIRIKHKVNQVGLDIGTDSENPVDYLKGSDLIYQTSSDINSSATPTITWTSPSAINTTLKSSKSNVKAIIKSPSGLISVLLYVNGVSIGEPEMEVLPNETGSYLVKKTINFSPGENNVYFVATNNEGSTRSEIRSFTYTPPVAAVPASNPGTPKVNASPVINLPAALTITWTSPSTINTTLKSSKSNVKAIIKSPSGLISVILYVNGVSFGEPEMEVLPNETGSYLVKKTLNFSPGENNVYFVATNNEGSTRSEIRSFTYTSPVAAVPASNPGTPKVNASPVINLPAALTITWTSPSTINTTLKSSKSNVKAIIKSPSGLISVILYVNGVSFGEPEMEVLPNETGSYLVKKTINFSPGENNIYFVATNNEGSTKSEIRSFTYSSTAAAVVPASNPGTPKVNVSPDINLHALPSITWTSPSAINTILKSSRGNVKAIIKSPTGLISVMLYVNGVSFGEPEMKALPNETGSYQVEKTIYFGPDENNIYLVATNNEGVTKSEIRYFTNPPTAAAVVPSSNPVTPNIAVPTSNPVTPNIAVPTSNPVTPKVNVSPETNLPAAPTITWTSPSGTNTSLESFNANVKAIIKSSSGLKSVLLYLNGISKGEADVKSSPKETGTFLVEKNINFGPGENNIYLVATNSVETTKSEIRYFTNPSAVPPVITWSNPATTSSLVNSESVNIEASIKSPTELKSIKLIVNGETQTEDNVFQVSGSDNSIYNWQTSVILKKGENSIYINATNIAGSKRSEQRVIKYETKLVEKRLALVFGNSDYKNSASLKNPVNDANLMEGTLKELGFDVIKRLNAGKDEMMAAIREFTEKLPKYNVALFYYAGHGNQVDGKNYLIPTDALLEKPIDCKFETIAVDFVVDEFERYPDNTNIVILDACRNKPFASWARGGDIGFRQITFTSGTIIAFATSEGATAADGKGSNGLYTEELVKQMTLPQSLHNVFLNTRSQVRKLSNNQQVPMEWDKLNADYYLKK